MAVTNYSYIAVDGLIGTGKTYLTTLLAKELGAAEILEDYANNPFLEKFYSDPEHFALPAQLFFLLSRRQQLITVSQTDLFHSCTISDYTFAKNAIFASVVLNEHELTLFNKIKDLLSDNIPVPDLILYLQADIAFLLERIRKRGVPCEKNITKEYLRLLNEAYVQYFFHVPDIPVMVINVAELELAENSPELLWLAGEINKPFHGIRYINPKK